MSQPLVSVLVPVFNSASTLPRALLSARGQSLRDIEILLGDDASTDHSAELAEQIAMQDNRLRVFRFASNRGKPAVMNALSAAARGEYLAVLDADDAYAPQRLERLVAACRDHHVEMAADNLLYVDSGVPGDGFGEIVGTGFAPGQPPRPLGRRDLFASANSFAAFDLGVLKPLLRRDFAIRTGLRYIEESRLAEDFTYLLNFFLAGGNAILLSDPLYYWTMPFGARSRRWTSTGAGPWRYDYRAALAVNNRLLAECRARGEPEAAAMLRRRGRQYRAMIAYIDAQRAAAAGDSLAAVRGILAHPVTWSLLARRVTGRALARLRGTAQTGIPAAYAGQRVA